MQDFFAMGGYAQYVWSAWSISLVVLCLSIALSKRSLTRTRASLKRRIASQQGAPQ